MQITRSTTYYGSLLVTAVLVALLPRMSHAQNQVQDQDANALRAQLDSYPVPALLKIERAEAEVQAALADDLVAIVHAGPELHRMRAVRILRALAQERPDPVATAYAKNLFAPEQRSEAVGRAVLSALQPLGPTAGAAAPVLAEGIRKYRQRREGAHRIETAVRALGHIGKPAADTAPLLASLLETDSATLKKATLIALRRIGPASPEPVDPLIAIMKREAGETRRLAVQALGAIGPEASAAIPAILSIEEESGDEVVQAARAALAIIKISNTAPRAETVRITATEGKAKRITLPVTDPDNLASSLTYEIVEQPSHGELTEVRRGVFTYRSTPGRVGADAFRWRVSDLDDAHGLADVQIDIQPDQAPPMIERASAPVQDRVFVRFDEPVSTASAADAARYAIEPAVAVKAAVVRDDRLVMLKTGWLSPDESYRLRVDGVRDRAKARNRVSDVGVDFAYTEPEGFERYAHGTSPSEIPGWRATGNAIIDGKTFAKDAAGHAAHMRLADTGYWGTELVRELPAPLDGRLLVEFKYWEQATNHKGFLFLENAEGERVAGAGTDNPQWLAWAGKPRVVNDGELGNDYKRWIHVRMQLDLDAARVRFTFRDTEDDEGKTYGWFDLPESQSIARLRVRVDRAWYVDDVGISRWSGEMTAASAE